MDSVFLPGDELVSKLLHLLGGIGGVGRDTGRVSSGRKVIGWETGELLSLPSRVRCGDRVTPMCESRSLLRLGEEFLTFGAETIGVDVITVVWRWFVAAGPVGPVLCRTGRIAAEGVVDAFLLAGAGLGLLQCEEKEEALWGAVRRCVGWALRLGGGWRQASVETFGVLASDGVYCAIV